MGGALASDPRDEGEAGPGDAVAGVHPRRRYEPSTRGECVEALRAARAGRMALAVVGGRTAIGLGAPPARLDAVVSTRRLDRLVAYEPADQVVEVEAGVRLATLQAALGVHRQRLACDPPLAERATLGGLVASNGFGPLRSRFGALRDLIIGVSLVRADGATARGGGKVVKNVAGFDLPKLMVGSLGTLGMIVTATFRLHPLPESHTTMRAGGLTAARVRALVARMQREHVEPAAVVASGPPGHFEVLLRFEGFAAGVREQRERAAVRLGEAVDELSPAEAAAAWAEHADLRTRPGTRLRVSALPAAFEEVTSGPVARVAAALADARITAYPTLGSWFVCGDAADVPALARALVEARAALPSGWIVVDDLPGAARAHVDVWGPVPPAFALMKRLKARFDPENRMNPGRFVGGL